MAGRRVLKSGQISKSTSLIKYSQKKQQDIFNTIVALEAFVNDNTLLGEAYSNAKGYVQSVLIPINKALYMALNDEIAANTGVVLCCSMYLAGVDLIDEDFLDKEIQKLRNRIDFFQHNPLSYCSETTQEQIAQYRWQIKTLKEQIAKLEAYDNATKGLHEGAISQMNTITQKINAIYSKPLFANGYYDYSGIDMSWANGLLGRWNERNESKIQYMKSFYNNLPDEMKNCVSLVDFKVTDDGFVICTKPMDEIMTEMGVPALKTESNSIGPSQYDDWYLGGIVGEDGLVTYTLIKMREPGDEQEGTGSSVPFIALDKDSFSNALKKVTNGQNNHDDLRAFYDELSKVTNAQGKENAALRDYFANPKSDGSYLIANCIVEKVANSNFDENNVWKLPVEFEKNDEYAQEYLNELNEKGIVYNKADNTIKINDRNNLTKDEYNAILTATTGNIDAYSYAAENQWHAELQNRVYINKKYSYYNFYSAFVAPVVEPHSIISDAGVGESKWGRRYEWMFKSPKSRLYKEQKHWHQKDI